MFRLSCTSDKIWNLDDLIAYLAAHQNQDIQITLVPEAIELENLGLYKLLDQFSFNSVTIKTWNPLETHSKYKIEFLGNNFWIDRTPYHDAADSLNTHAFLCLYHRPTAARLGIAGYLKKNHAKNSIIHFSAKTDVDSRVHFELDKLLSWDLDSVANAGDLIQDLPLLQYSSERLTSTHGYDYNDPLTSLYDNTFVDLVVESHVAGRTFFPTEKTFRPIILGKPFIIFGSRNYLAYMRQMGFQTFWEHWDESYDGYDSAGRLHKIYQLIDYIGKMSAEQRTQLAQDIKPVVDYNRNLLLSRKWSNRITLIND